MRPWLLPFILAIETLLFAILTAPELRNPTELLNYLQNFGADILTQATPVLLLAFGMTLILMTGGIDLSVASQVALIACAMASFPANGGFWMMAVPFGLALGLILGITNGVLIARLDIPPVITTLGTMILYRGLCFVIMGDLEKAPFLEVPGYGQFGTIAGSVAALVLVFVGGGWFFARSAWRREILTLGGNRVAARYAGIEVSRRVCEVYALGGILAFLAALSFTARNGSVSASSLAGLELQVIVAVVLGGTRVQGGAGSIGGTFCGVLILAVLEEGLRGAAGWVDTSLPFKISHLRYLLLGLFLVLGVWVNTKQHRTSSKPKLPEKKEGF